MRLTFSADITPKISRISFSLVPINIALAIIRARPWAIHQGLPCNCLQIPNPGMKEDSDNKKRGQYDK
jgi:hypothetical protein